MADARDELIYAHSEIPKTTNWMGPFIIGLAGTILVTGIAPVIAAGLGSAGVYWMIFWTITGYLLCLFLAELAAMMPDRTGGAPAYAYVAFKERWPRLAVHINGFCAWAYWHGWFPVAPLNMILASFYLVQLFHLPTTGIVVLGTSIAWWTIGIAIGGILLLFIPAYLGMRFSQNFGLVLALLSMIPMTFLSLCWVFNLKIVHWGDAFSGKYPDLGGFFSSQHGTNWFTYGAAWSFLILWNVIAMEAAACYLGETKNPGRDAKISMNLEGAYGIYIYAMVPISFILVIGLKAIGNPALADPKTIFLQVVTQVFGTGAKSTIIEWLVAWMLILALTLSALNAITGCGRSLYQSAADKHLPRWFGQLNKYGVPHNAMFFNVVSSIIIVFLGGAVQIYTFSNVGYLPTFIPVLIGYFILRHDRPDVLRPFRLPEWMKWVALVVAALYILETFYGGPIWAISNFTLSGQSTLVYYVIGLVTVFTYFPLYLWRRSADRRREARGLSSDL
jgi:amino acid transporter